jgi:hypothetical protein
MNIVYQAAMINKAGKLKNISSPESLKSLE